MNNTYSGSMIRQRRSPALRRLTIALLALALDPEYMYLRRVDFVRHIADSYRSGLGSRD